MQRIQVTLGMAVLLAGCVAGGEGEHAEALDVDVATEAVWRGPEGQFPFKLRLDGVGSTSDEWFGVQPEMSVSIWRGNDEGTDDVLRGAASVYWYNWNSTASHVVGTLVVTCADDNDTVVQFREDLLTKKSYSAAFYGECANSTVLRADLAINIDN